MKKLVVRFLLTSLGYYLALLITPHIFMMPSGVVRVTSFIPPILGLMWGPVAAVGIFFGEFFADNNWGLFFQTMEAGWSSTAYAHFFGIFYRAAAWAILATYLPYRLWHSIAVRPWRSRFPLGGRSLIKFVAIIFISMLTLSLFMGLTTHTSDFARMVSQTDPSRFRVVEYAFLIFINNFNIAVMFGCPIILTLIRSGYHFHRPAPTLKPIGAVWEWIDLTLPIYYLIIAAILFRSAAFLDTHMLVRFIASLPFFILCFRPFSPVKESKAKQEISKSHSRDLLFVEFHIYALFVVLFFVLDLSGLIQNLDTVEVWWQFSSEILTIMAFTMVILSLALVYYRRSIIMWIMLLIVDLVFVAMFVMGSIGLVAVNRILDDQAQVDLEQIGLIETEHLARSFDGVQQSVGSMRDFMKADLQSYEKLVTDTNYRMVYIRNLERNCSTIAENTDGCVAFYVRLAPEIAKEHIGFLWSVEHVDFRGREDRRFRKRELTDLGKFRKDDIERVGWYYIPVSRGIATWLEPYHNKNLGIYMISYVIPVYQGGRLIGIVGMDINFNRIIREVERMSIYRRGYAYLLDKDNRVLYHKDYNPGDKITPSPDIREAETNLSNGMKLVIAGSNRELYAQRNSMVINFIIGMFLMAMLLSIISLLLVRFAIRPLISVTDAAEEIAEGNLEVKLPNIAETEIGRLVTSIKEMVAKLEVYVYRDKLTGLRNPTAYGRMSKDVESRSLMKGAHYAVVVFDANGLKQMNDNYGHEAGNELIKNAASIICNVYSHSPVFRIGGDEFAAILENHDYEHRDELLQEFLEVSMKSTITVSEVTLPVSVAAGMGVHEEGESYAAVFNRADEEMYKNKIEIKKKLNMPMR